MIWTVIRTDRFSEEFKRFEKDKEFVDALDKKIKRLEEDPTIGGFLAGKLHGYKSIRLVKNFRVLYRIDEDEKKFFWLRLITGNIVTKDSNDAKINFHYMAV